MDNRMGRRRASEAWFGLDESTFIDEKTESLSARLTVYNSVTRSLGVAKMTFMQRESGMFTSVLEVRPNDS
jgi:hypothetical protein